MSVLVFCRIDDAKKISPAKQYSEFFRSAAPVEEMPHEPFEYKYEFTAIVMFRLSFKGDLLNFTHSELEQWMRYLSYAGVQHFYLYDSCYEPEECLDSFNTTSWQYQWGPDNVTYVKWKHPTKWTEQHQLGAYNDHFKKRHPGTSLYELNADIDEYPFMPQDTEEGFLLRFARKHLGGPHRKYDHMLMRTNFFNGPAETNHSWRAMRYFHREEEQITAGRTKAIYRTEAVATNQQKGNMHMAMLLPVSVVNASILAGDVGIDRRVSKEWKKDTESRTGCLPDIIRLNHYWCERKEQAPPVFDDSINQVMDKIFAQDKERSTPPSLMMRLYQRLASRCSSLST